MMSGMKHHPRLRTLLLTAIGIFLMAVGCSGYGAEGQIEKGTKYLAEGNAEKALAAFEKAIEGDPSNMATYTSIANAYAGTSYTEQGAALLQQAIETTGENIELLTALRELGYSPRKYQEDGSYNMIRYHDCGTIEFSYDADGRCTKAIWYNNDGSLLWDRINEYDADGNCFRITRHDRYGNWSTQEFIHNENGMLAIDTKYRSDNVIDSFTFREYDAEGVLLRASENSVRVVDNLFGDGYSAGNRWEYEYDENGNMTKKTNYDEEKDEIEIYYTYEYDENGNMTKETEHEKNRSSNLYKYTVYEYNAHGNCIKSMRYSGRDLLLKSGCITEYEYDADGNRIQETVYNTTNGTDRIIDNIMNYDSCGNLLKRTWYSSDGTLSWYITFEYDDAGNKLKEITYNADSSINDSQIYEYDSEGNLLKETYYDGDNSVDFYWTYEYDSVGNLLKETRYDDDNSVTRYRTYEYDSEWNCLKETTFENDGSISEDKEYRYTYAYDSAGNKYIKRVLEKCTTDDVIYYLREYDSENHTTQLRLFSEPFIEYGSTVYVVMNYMTNKIYDNDGLLIQNNPYDAVGFITYQYDDATEKENTTQEIWYEFDVVAGEGDIFTTETISEYDAQGNCIKKTTYDTEDNIESMEEFTYDEHGNCVKETWFSVEDGSSYTLNEYDAQGNCTKETNHNSDGTVSTIYTNSYDASGICTERTVYIEERSDYWKHLNEYFPDSNGKLTAYDESDGSRNGYVLREYDPLTNTILRMASYDADGNFEYIMNEIYE